MKKFLLSVSLLIFFLVGCEEKGVQPEENNANETEELTNLQIQIEELRSQLDELKSSIEFQYEQNNQSLNQLLFTDEKLEHIIKHLPNVERKFGYIEQMNRNDTETTLHVQLVDMIHDDTMPNNYRLEDLEIANVTVSIDALMYALDGVTPVKINDIDELNDIVNEHKRLFIFTIINDKAVLITEQYLP